jgi:hypothetical protein
MPLQGDDIIDFFDLLKDPTIAQYIHRSPQRWQLYGAMILQGLRLGGLVAAGALRQAFGLAGQQEDVLIQVPPPSIRKKKKKAAAKQGAEAVAEEKQPRRRRLSSRTTSAPSLTTSMKPSAAPAFASLESPEEVEDAIQEAMAAAESLA